MSHVIRYVYLLDKDGNPINMNATGVPTIQEDGAKIELISEYADVTVEDLLLRVYETNEQMLITLKKIEYHLSIASDTELKDQDV